MKEELDFKVENIPVLNNKGSKVKLYSIESPIKFDGDVINVHDPKGRISSYFIWNEDDSNFLKFMTPQGIAQSKVLFSDMSKADFLPANIGVPIFSEKAMNVIEGFICGQVQWTKIVVSCEGKEIVYYLCRVNNFLSLIDEEKSFFRILTEGERILSKAVYKDGFENDFIIARDIHYKERLVVTQTFVNFCHYKKLKINFGSPK